MAEKAGAQISRKAFVQSLAILLALMLVAGVATRIVPAGQYDRVIVEGREVIDPGSYQPMPRPRYPVWRWFTAPVEVLWGPDAVTLIVVAMFVLMVSVAVAILDRSGALRAAVARVVKAFGARKYVLLAVVSLFFMLLGAFFGLFEEVVPLVPLMIALSYSLGWDSLVGLGMSVLATNMGFSAAIMNPFTLGVAQTIAELPLFSGAWLRVVAFVIIYALLVFTLVRYARRIDRDPSVSPVCVEDRAAKARLETRDPRPLLESTVGERRALVWFGLFFVLIIVVLIAGPFIPPVSEAVLPLVGLLFLVGGTGAGMASGIGGRAVLRSIAQGVTGIAPALPLVLMAASISHIVVQGGILDTILHSTSAAFARLGPFPAALAIYGFTLLIEFFVPSGSAKAFLIMPIVLPLADLVGVTRQVAVTAYAFGDGFSNMAYPTNPVLLICLGLTVVSSPKWLKWSSGLWLAVLVVTVAFLGLAVAIGYGPF